MLRMIRGADGSGGTTALSVHVSEVEAVERQYVSGSIRNVGSQEEPKDVAFLPS